MFITYFDDNGIINGENCESLRIDDEDSYIFYYILNNKIQSRVIACDSLISIHSDEELGIKMFKKMIKDTGGQIKLADDNTKTNIFN